MTSSPHLQPESLRLELQEALTTLRHLTTLITQVAAFVATADSLLLAYGFSQKIGGIFLIAATMPVIMLISFSVIANTVRPIIYVTLTLERELHLHDTTLGVLYAKFHVPNILPSFDKLSNSRESGIPKSILSFPARNWLASGPAYVIYAIFTVQIGLFLVSLRVYHFRFM